MKYYEIEDKNLFKNWLGASEIRFNGNVKITFNDWDCYNIICKEFCTATDIELSKHLDDMEIIITNETFENIIEEYDLQLAMKDSLVVLN